MTSDFAKRGARGGGAMVLGQAAKLLIQMASVVVLSRLLPPEDFGLIAMTTVFLTLGTMLRDFGLPTAALQARDLSDQQASNLFWINVALGVAGAALMVAATPLVVALYSEPRLSEILPFMAITLVIGGFAAQSQVQLARAMRFKSLALAGVAAQLMGLLVSISGALLGLGYWALAWAAIANGITLLVVQSLAAQWRPSRPRRRAGTRAVVTSGSHFGLAQLLGFAASNADTVFIGARWDAADVGYYNRAYQLLMMPIQAMLSPLTNVVMPIAHRARDAGHSVDNVLLRIQSALGVSIVWLFAASVASAQYLIPVLLGPGWDVTAHMFQILAIGGAVQAFSFVSYWAFILHEQSKQLLYYNLVTKSLTVIAVACGSLFSVEAVAIAYAASLVLSWPINLIWLSKSAGQRSGAYFLNGARALLAGAVAVVAVWALMQLLPADLSNVTCALIALCSASLLYLAVLGATSGGRKQMRDALAALKLVLSR